MDGNRHLLSFIDFILSSPQKSKTPIIIDDSKLKNEFDFNSFEDDDIFYTKILYQLINKNDKNKVLENIRGFSNLFKRNLFVFLEYLRTLIYSNNFKELYKDPIVKLDISLIIGYLVNKYGEKIVKSIEFFPSCIKELEKKYGKNQIDKTIYDIDIKKDAELKYEFFEAQKRGNFSDLIEYLQKYYTDSAHLSTEDSEKIDEIKIKSENLTMDELDSKYINNEEFQKHMDIYLQNELSINGYIDKNYKKGKEDELYKKKKQQIKNHLFYSEVFKIDINNINDCIYLLHFEENLYKGTIFYDTDEEFKKLISRKETNDFTENLTKIIEGESFIKDLKEILNQKFVKDYFEKARKFLNEEDEDSYDISFIEKEKVIKGEDDFLKDGFDRFMNFINNKKDFFSKLFIFKYLPKYKRAFVDPNMRIVISPIYFELSESLDEKKRDEIFRAYLLIIILHEIIHLVKFMKEKSVSYKNIPQTPKRKEGGKMFINYLFKTPMIYSINYKQASMINKPENWNKPELLSDIFKEQNEWYENNKKNKNEDIIIPLPKGENSINFYLSLMDDNKIEKKSKNTIDIWYDID